jgi:hypothetical protein
LHKSVSKLKRSVGERKMAERTKQSQNGPAKKKYNQGPSVGKTQRSITEPGQGEDTTQAGEVLYREMKQGKVDLADSTPKPIGKKPTRDSESS